MEASALILAAGAGTRMKSSKPKVAHQIFGKPLVRWVVDAAHAAGIDSVVGVVGHGREQVEPLLADVTTVVQEEQLGTAHAVLAELVRTREEANAAVVVLTMEAENPTGYGRIIRDAAGDVQEIVEQKDCTPEQAAVTECNSGFYCFDIETLFAALEEVSTDNAQGEYYLTDVLGIARNQGKRVLGLKAEDASECLGVNSRRQLAEATKVLQQRINGMHMDNGVAIMDPATTWIGPDVTIEPDVEILPMTFLMGATSIATGSVVGPNSRLTDTTVGANCQVEETVAIETVLDADVTCGPRAYLRPGTHMCEGSTAGTHVEIKKSTIGKGSKVPHLSYIGDTTMGEGVNIGAGSITCNYDGEKKWPTTIGDNCFVGSDVMMVAPVTLGENSLIGAGSVITKDVSAGALGLGRARQTEIEHWNERKKN